MKHTTALLFGVVLALPAPVLGADEKESDRDELDERPVAIAELPDAAREAILREAGEHEILEVEAFTFRGATYYEAEWHAGRMEIEIVVTPSGEIVERETEPLDEPDDEIDDD